MPPPLVLPAFATFLGLACSPAQEPPAPEPPGRAEQRHAGRPPLPSPEELAELPPDGGPRFNRLVFERSPYLLQHAANAVDWYPWGEEAFERARAEDRPVFLSIGYSTCHWCHVMERESFEDAEVAALLNRYFVCIKVDREERPDIDHQYMAVTQAMTGGGGWPMTVVMTPGKEPFFAATYIPKRGRLGRKGMLQLVPDLGELWRDQREDVVARANEIGEWMLRLGDGNPGDAPGAEALADAARQLAARFDPEFGGFARKPPKFPIPHNLLFLLQRAERTGDAKARSMVLRTLRAMRRGGIYDQVGYGFHRYSTDARWLVPHFEKMLYDQALHIMAYTAAYQVTGDEVFRRTAEEVLTYVSRDMTAPEGGFYSAEDADSEGEEGLFYLWTRAEVLNLLGAEEGELYCRVYGISEEGNFLDEATRELSGRNIPHLERPLPQLAAELELEEPALRARLEAARAKLFALREGRVHPLKDDKILTDWNGLMIAALARAAQAFDEPRHAAAAERAANFALTRMRDADGRLYKRYRAGEAGLPGTLEDYAFLVWGLLELHEATFELRWLRAAIELTDAMIAHFEDPERGGFFLSADDVEGLLVRGKEAYDGAIPSGTSVAAWNLLRLARITGDTAYEERAAGALRSFGGTVARNPAAHAQLLMAVDFAVGPSFEIVVAGDPEGEETRDLVRAFRARYLPHKVLLLRPPGEDPPIAALAPFTRAQAPLDGRTTVYVCRDYACKEPTTDAERALSFLDPASWGE